MSLGNMVTLHNSIDEHGMKCAYNHNTETRSSGYHDSTVWTVCLARGRGCLDQFSSYL
jgi:hypothetical protein